MFASSSQKQVDCLNFFDLIWFDLITFFSIPSWTPQASSADTYGWRSRRNSRVVLSGPYGILPSFLSTSLSFLISLCVLWGKGLKEGKFEVQQRPLIQNWLGKMLTILAVNGSSKRHASLYHTYTSIDRAIPVGEAFLLGGHNRVNRGCKSSG